MRSELAGLKEPEPVTWKQPLSASVPKEYLMVQQDEVTDLDLSTGLIELRTTSRACAMKSNELDTHEVVAWRNARRHREFLPAKTLAVHVLDHGVDSPDTGRSHCVGRDLEPREAGLR